MCLQIYCGTVLDIKLATKFPWKIQKSGRMAEQQWSFCWAIGCPVPTYSFAPHSRLNISKNNTFMWKPTGTQITQFRLLKPETYVGLLKLKCYTLLVNKGRVNQIHHEHLCQCRPSSTSPLRRAACQV